MSLFPTKKRLHHQRTDWLSFWWTTKRRLYSSRTSRKPWCSPQRLPTIGYFWCPVAFVALEVTCPIGQSGPQFSFRSGFRCIVPRRLIQRGGDFRRVSAVKTVKGFWTSVFLPRFFFQFKKGLDSTSQFCQKLWGKMFLPKEKFIGILAWKKNLKVFCLEWPATTVFHEPGKKLGFGETRVSNPTFQRNFNSFILEFQDTEVSWQVLRKNGWPTPCRDCFWLSIERVFFCVFFFNFCCWWIYMHVCLSNLTNKNKGIIELQVCQSATSNEGFVPTPSSWHSNQSTTVWRPGTMKDLGLKKGDSKTR